MLTQNHLEKLENYINHPRYGILLQKAIKSWKEVKPSRLTFGILSRIVGLHDNERKLIFIPNSYQECCLIGASLIGEDGSDEKIVDTVCLVFNLQPEEVGALISGFDSCIYEEYDMGDWSKEAWEFGRDIGRIVIEKVIENG
jgi:hypothetical protein